ncbi:MAG: N-carbamoylputrescine amidase [Desulfovibrio sp.]|uniref:N-carbamoylputrescine amidase n=1 Tax=Desulfovibrio sp. 7SRBS1 TaxID=3378064 RepID=UPI003B3CB0C5
MKITVAATQMACVDDARKNIDHAESLIRQAKRGGADIVLLQELFSTPYFCQDQKPEYFALAHPLAQDPAVMRMRELARELEVVLPVSFFEKDGQAYYNSLAMIDADGSILGVYRKTHIPDGVGYQEKYYFNPGDTGFKVWNTRYGNIGVGICWDQWFPECARSMALRGADILMYPTAIGSEPPKPDWDSSGHWTRVMQGHAGANVMPLVASNRIGKEVGESSEITFYGSSFIAGPTGEIIHQADKETEDVLLAEFDFDEIRELRAGWGVFRDRRPSLYGGLLGCGSASVAS